MPRRPVPWVDWKDEVDWLFSTRQQDSHWSGYRPLAVSRLTSDALSEAAPKDTPTAAAAATIRAQWRERPDSVAIIYIAVRKLPPVLGVERLTRISDGSIESVAVEASTQTGTVPENWDLLLAVAEEAFIRPGVMQVLKPTTQTVDTDATGDGDQQSRINPPVTVGVVDGLSWLDSVQMGPSILADLDLSGGGFGFVYEGGTAPDSQALVVKIGKQSGGSRSSTYMPDLFFPARSYDVSAEPPTSRTIGSDAVDEVLLAEAELLRLNAGSLLPRLYGVKNVPNRLTGEPRPSLVIEKVFGRPPTGPRDLVLVLRSLAEAADLGNLDFHGDLKPEHIFVNDGRVRIVDPAPRFEDPFTAALTPEYNPYALTGPAADIFALAVMLYRQLAAVLPFQLDFRSIPPATTPSPVARGRLEIPRPLAEFVDTVLGIKSQPSHTQDQPWWMDTHEDALVVLERALNS